MTTTISTTDKGATQAVTNGGLTVKNTGAGGDGLARTVDVPTGKVFCQMVVDSTNGAESCTVGVCTTTSALTDWLGTAANELGFAPDTGKFYTSGSASSTVALTLTSGDVLDIAIDYTAKLMWVSKDGVTWFGGASGTQNPATAAGGKSFSTFTGTLTFGVTQSDGSGNSVTFRFSSASWSRGAPSGFGEFNPAVAIQHTFAAILGRFITPDLLLPPKRRFFVPGFAL